MSKNSKNQAKANAKKPDVRANSKKQPTRANCKKQDSDRGVKIFLFVFAIVAVLGISVSIFFAIWTNYNKNRRIDYLNDNLSKYVYIAEEDYKNVSVDSTVPPLSDIDVATRLTQILAEYKGESKYDGANVSYGTVGPGDSVNVWYRGYLLDEEGNKQDFSFKLNTLNYVNCVIGSGSYLFEYGLVGARRDDYARLSVRDSGTVGEGDLVEIEYYVYYPDGTGDDVSNSENRKASALVDLGSAYTAERFGLEFADRLIGKQVGETLDMFSTTSMSDEGKTIYFTDVEILRAYDYVGDKQPLTVKVEFPHNYENSVELRGKTAYFDMFIKNAVHYESATFDDAFVSEKLKLTEEDLKEYEGESLSEKYMDFLLEYLKDEREAEKRAEIEEALFAHYLEKAQIKKLPEFEVKAYYSEMYAELRAMYEAEETAEYTFDSYAAMILGIENTDWQSTLRQYAEESVKEKLILFYIINEENLIPTEEEYTQTYEDMIHDYLIDYLEDVGCKRENFDTEEAYNARVALYKEQMIKYYGEDYLEENVYYIFAMKTLITYAVVE